MFSKVFQAETMEELYKPLNAELLGKALYLTGGFQEKKRKILELIAEADFYRLSPDKRDRILKIFNADSIESLRGSIQCYKLIELAQPESLLTVQEAATVLNVNSATVQKYIKTGKLPAVNLRHEYRISKVILDAWIARGMKNPRFPPSQLDRTIKCPFKAWEEVQTVKKHKGESRQTARGKNIHQMAKEFLTGLVPELENDQAKEYCEFINNLLSRYDGQPELIVEGLIDLSRHFYTKGSHVDAAIVGQKDMCICDLKSGKTEVKAKDNVQLKLYGLALLEVYTAIQKVHLFIVQPDLHKVKGQTLRNFELIDWITYAVQPVLNLIKLGFKIKNPGPHCKGCRTRCDVRA